MGSPMRVFSPSLMSTVSNRILPAAATAAWLILPQYCNWFRRRAISPNFVFNRAPMSTVADRILPAAATPPWLMLPPTYEYGGNMFNRLFKVNGKMNYNFYSPTDNKVISVSKRSSIGEEKLKVRSEKQAVVVGSSHGWLALYKAKFNLDLFLYNPLSHRHIKLPPVEKIPLDKEDEEELRSRWGRPIKVILSCSPDDPSNSCRAIMSFAPRCYMAVCHPGRSTEWTPFGAQVHEYDEITRKYKEDCIVRSYHDFVYSTTLKQLFCVTQFADFESWDLGDKPNKSPKLNWKKAECDLNYDEYIYPLLDYDQDSCIVYKYLVFAEHSKQLFLVRRLVLHHMASDGSCVKPISILENFVPHKTVGFYVHEIDKEKGELRYMKSTLNGMSFFIGSTGHGRVVESPETMNLKPNSIYFTDPDFKTPYDWDTYKTYGGHDIGIFDYTNSTISPCYYPCDIKKVKRIQPAPMWFTPSPSPSPSPSPV